MNAFETHITRHHLAAMIETSETRYRFKLNADARNTFIGNATQAAEHLATMRANLECALYRPVRITIRRPSYVSASPRVIASDARAALARAVKALLPMQRTLRAWGSHALRVEKAWMRLQTMRRVMGHPLLFEAIIAG